jgi:hypothetical protein
MLRAGIWRDEATSYFTATLPTAAAVVNRVSYAELNPPGFFLLLHAWASLAGHSDVLLKCLPLAFGLLALAVSFALAMRSSSSQGQFVFCAALLSANFACAYYATELRPYSTVELLVSIGVLCAIVRIQAPSRPNIRAEIAGALALAAAAYVSYVAFFAIVGIGAAALLVRLRPRGLLRFEFAFVCVPALLSLPLVPLMRLQHGYSFISQSSTIGLRALTFANLISQALPVEFNSWSYRVSEVAGLCVLALALYALWESFAGVRDPRRAAVAFVTATFLVTCACEAALSLGSARYAVAVVPLGCIAVGSALVSLFARLRERAAIAPAFARPAAACIVVLVLAAGIVEQCDASSHPKSAIAGLPALLPHAPNVAYVIAPDFDAQTFAYYNGSSSNVYGFARFAPSDVFDLRGYRTIWNAPSAVDDAMARVRDLRMHGISEVIFIRMGPLDRRITAYDGIAYAKTDDLRARLLATYPLIARGCYGSDNIDVFNNFASVYALRLGPNAPATTLAPCVHDHHLVR